MLPPPFYFRTDIDPVWIHCLSCYVTFVFGGDVLLSQFLRTESSKIVYIVWDCMFCIFVHWVRIYAEASVQIWIGRAAYKLVGYVVSE